ncbi:MAG: anaerobic glycerol-3-phosphate dehydrogenase subunit A [Mailhella sp.]|nr:anaerobic glycerol-3-phosphate dehydrogenase subunit A [Mailhella sp.]
MEADVDHATVVIIGGGATGIGILRDLSMRGIQAVLLEQGCIAAGASSRYHGLLHSGARYAVKDNDAARECIEENMVLRRIGSQCVEVSEGFFVLTDQDDPAFERPWVEACAKAGIKTEQIDVKEALRLEPNLSRSVKAVYRVPDSSVDGFRLIWHNALSARRYGGEMLTHHQVFAIEQEGGRVKGVHVLNTVTGQKSYISCNLLVNAAGSWSGNVAKMVGLDVAVQPDRGTLVAFNHRFTSRILNRLHKSSDGDIFVPHGSITILGTTSFHADRPDAHDVPTEDILKLLDIGEALIPDIRTYRILRAFAGTRPLYAGKSGGQGREVSRGFHIADHQEDGLEGMVSIFGGKFTTYRLMAEKLSDLVCKKLGVHAACRTAEEPLIEEPSAELLEKAKKYFPVHGVTLAANRLGAAFPIVVEKAAALSSNPLLCECEMVSRAEIEYVASDPSTTSMNDIRIRTRMGMGTCQGTFCSLRTIGALSECRIPFPTPPTESLHHFLQERWKGLRPAIWGIQAKEMELGRSVYAATLNIDGALNEQKN